MKIRSPGVRSFLLSFFLFVFAPLLMAQDIRMTEFLVLNGSSIKDEDGTRSSWIEIWNPSFTTTVSLNGWKLTDGTTTWTFPSVSLIARDRTIVWASGKNRTVTTSPLHTNFTLNQSGGTLQLTRADNSVAMTYTYPAQTADVSYGCDENDVNARGFYTSPTPEQPNNYVGTGVAGDVLFSVASRTFTSAFQVTLSQESPVSGALIRYTIDGTLPSASSSLYTAPITISSTRILRARVFQTGKLPGEPEAQSYLQLDSTTSAFSSGMPVVVLTNFSAGDPTTGDSPNPPFNTGYMWVFEQATDGIARLNSAPTLATRIAMDKRGSSTINNPKYNLNIETRKDRGEEEKDVVLLGMPAHSDWVFSAPWDFDRSLVHNPFIYSLSNKIGRWAPRTRLAEVFIDINGGALSMTTGQSGDYFGIYNVLEKIRVGSDRVDIKKLNRYDNSSVVTNGTTTGPVTGGYIWKVDRKDSGDSGFTTTHEGPSASPSTLGFAYYYPKESDILTNQRDPQEQYLKSLCQAFDASCYAANFTDPVLGYRRYLDVPAAIDHHLLDVWPMNVDGLRLSGYLHKDRDGKIVYGPIWDFDRTMESTDNRDDQPAVWRSPFGDLGTDFFNYTWWNRLFSDLEFYQAYIDRWTELRVGGPFAASSINAMLDQLNAQMPTASISRDLARWGMAKRSWTSPFTGQTFTGQTGEIQRIKDWLEQRAKFMMLVPGQTGTNGQWVTPVGFSVTPGTVASGSSVALSGPAGSTIYYTLDGSDPRPTGGAVPSSGNVFTYAAGQPIVISAPTRIRARAYSPTWNSVTGANNPPLASKWSGVLEARYTTAATATSANLTVTEVNYNPAAPTAAELAINSTWTRSSFEFIELKNISGAPVDIGGVNLSSAVVFGFTGANAFVLPPGGFAIVAADPAAFAARYGTIPNVVGPWQDSLGNASERIIVTGLGGVPIADFTYFDTWYPPSDGDGYTLAAYNTNAPASAFNTAANWRASIALLGSPGADEPNRPPVADAGLDVVGNLPGLNLTGSAADDTVAPASLSITWSKLLGPGTAVFAAPTAASTGVTFDLPGQYVLRMAVNDGSLSATDDVSVTVRDTPDAWLSRNPGIGTLNDDKDGDGLTNFTEWALLTSPTSGDTANGVTLGSENGKLTLTYNRQKNTSAVKYVVQFTNDLATWQDAGPTDVTETIQSDNGIAQSVKVTDSVSVTDQPRRFLRLKVLPQP